MLASPITMHTGHTCHPFDPPQPFKPLGTPMCASAQIKYVVGAPKVSSHHHRSQTLETPSSPHAHCAQSPRPSRRSTCPEIGKSQRAQPSVHRTQSFSIPPTSYFLPSPYSPEEVRITQTSGSCPPVSFPQPHIYSYPSQAQFTRSGYPNATPCAQTYGHYDGVNDVHGGPGIISDDIRLDLVGCDVLVRSVKEVEDCAAIFASWVEQIDLYVYQLHYMEEY